MPRRTGSRTLTTGLALATLLSATLAAAPGHADAGDIVVTTLAASGAGSLRDALEQASSTPDADRIVFDPSLRGTIGIAGETLLAEVNGQSGDLVIEGPGADALAIDAYGNRRLLDVVGPGGDARPLVSITGLTLRGGAGYSAATADTPDGGAVRATGVDLWLEGVVVRGNVADGHGGGVYVGGGSLDVVGSRIVGNTAEHGGGVSIDGAGSTSSALTIADSVIAENTAVPDSSAGYASGGGIHAAPGTSATVTDSVVQDNVAAGPVSYTAGCGYVGDGGGVHAGDLAISDSVVSGNRAAGDGGGVVATSLTMSRSTVSSNHARSGGGVALLGSSGEPASLVDSSTVAGNVAEGGGAVSAHLDHDVTVRLSTLAANSAPIGGGLRIGGQLTLEGTVVAMNSGGDLAGSGQAFADSSMVEDPREVPVTVVGTPVAAADPLLSRLSVHGSGPATLLPAPNSPLVDAGDSFGATADQRGLPRPTDDPDIGDAGDGTDIGAVELTVAEQAGPPQVANLRVPLISGRARVGKTLTADAGGWAPETDLVSFQWLRDGVPIPLADEASYTLTSDDYGWNGRCADSRHRLSVRVTATAEGHRSGTAVSEVTPRVELGRLQIMREARVTGRLRVGSTLRAEPRLGSISPPPDDVRIRWFLDDLRVRPPDRQRLELRPRMRGKRVSVEFRYDAPYGYGDVTQRVERRRRVR